VKKGYLEFTAPSCNSAKNKAWRALVSKQHTEPSTKTASAWWLRSTRKKPDQTLGLPNDSDAEESGPTKVPGPVEMAKTASIDWNLLEKLETNLKKRDLVALKYSVKFFCTAALNHFYPLGFDHA